MVKNSISKHTYPAALFLSKLKKCGRVFILSFLALIDIGAKYVEKRCLFD